MNFKAKIVKLKEERREKYDDGSDDNDFILDVDKPMRVLHTRGYYYICVEADSGGTYLRDAIVENNYEQIHEDDVDVIEEGDELTPIRFRS